MDPNRALSYLVDGVRAIQAQREGDELPLDDYINLVDQVCEAADALDSWMRSGGFAPSAWKGDREHALVRACRGLLWDINEVLERQGEEWWDETVTSGIHNRTVAEELLGERSK